MHRQEPADAALDHLRKATHTRRNDGHFAHHRLERRQAEALRGRREQEQVGRRQERAHVALVPHSLHVVAEPEVAGDLQAVRQLRAVADEHQCRRDRPADPGEHLDHG